MYIDNLTASIAVWGVVTVAIVLAIYFYDECRIKKLLGKPCPEDEK